MRQSPFSGEQIFAILCEQEAGRPTAESAASTRSATRRYTNGNGVLRTRLIALAACRRRFGYLRLHLLLGREGIAVNYKKLYRIYREENLVGRKRALGLRTLITLPSAANERWSLDFVSDAFADGRRFRVLCVVDDFTRECLGLVAEMSLSGARVARELDGVIAQRGLPPAQDVRF